MSNRAATLATRERRQLARHLEEVMRQATDLQSALYGHGELSDLDESAFDEVADKVIDLHSVTDEMVARLVAWAAFIEVASDGE